MKSPFLHRLLLVLPLIISSADQVKAAAPPNDAFANAIVLNGPIVSTTGNNVGATKQFGQEPFFIGGSFGGASVWWNWTPPASGLTTIDTLGSDFNTILGVYTGPPGNQLALIAENDDYNGNQWSRVQFTAVAGTTYHILVDGFGPPAFPPRAATGNIVLNVHGVGG